METQLVSHAYLGVMTHQWRHLVSSISASLHLSVWTRSLPFLCPFSLLPPEIHLPVCFFFFFPLCVLSLDLCFIDVKNNSVPYAEKNIVPAGVHVVSGTIPVLYIVNTDEHDIRGYYLSNIFIDRGRHLRVQKGKFFLKLMKRQARNSSGSSQESETLI